jgi:hypothetical protein
MRLELALLSALTAKLFSGQSEAEDWKEAEPSVSIDGTRTIVFTRSAVEDVDIGEQKIRPGIGVKCTSSKRFDIAVLTYRVLQNGYVRIRLDDGKPKAESWTESGDNKLLFSPNPARLAKQFASTHYFYIEWTPFHQGPVMAKFDVSGFTEQFAKTCRNP